MMSQRLFIDVLPVDSDSHGKYKVLLLGYRNGAPPRIEPISAEELFQRLESVLAWPKETTSKLCDDLSRIGTLSTIGLDSPPTYQQLQELGFTNL